MGETPPPPPSLSLSCGHCPPLIPPTPQSTGRCVTTVRHLMCRAHPTARRSYTRFWATSRGARIGSLTSHRGTLGRTRRGVLQHCRRSLDKGFGGHSLRRATGATTPMPQARPCLTCLLLRSLSVHNLVATLGPVSTFTQTLIGVSNGPLYSCLLVFPQDLLVRLA
jgi:hypothetical protein